MLLDRHNRVDEPDRIIRVGQQLAGGHEVALAGAFEGGRVFVPFSDIVRAGKTLPDAVEFVIGVIRVHGKAVLGVFGHWPAAGRPDQVAGILIQPDTYQDAASFKPLVVIAQGLLLDESQDAGRGQHGNA